MSKKAIAILCLAALLCLGTLFAPTLASAQPTIVLRLGDEGQAVQVLQQKLKKLGYYTKNETTTYFGIITQSSVSEFQKQNGLDQDGVAGAQTLKMLLGDEYDGFVNQYAAAVTNSRPTSAAASGTRQYSEAVLKLGDENEEVTKLQKRLKELGFFAGEATGFFGSVTQQAVLAFQADRDLSQDGSVGALTLAALYAQEEAPTERKYSLDTLIPGDEGAEVTKLQTRLKELGYYQYNVTGFFGPITSEALKAFQKNNNLDVDGIAGKNTRNKVFAANAVAASQAPATEAPAATPGDKQPTSVVRSSDGELTAANVIEYAKQFMGVKYVYGGNGPDSFDCTGLTTYVFKQFGITLPRTARDQGYNDYAPKIDSAEDLLPGDLVFFKTTNDSGLSNHAGIYIGGGQFIHAASGSSKKVMISALDSGYYQRAFSWGRRVIE